MKCIQMFLILFLIWSSVLQIQAATIETRGRVSNSTYVVDRFDTTHVRLYQYLRFSATAPEWAGLSFNFHGRAFTDSETDFDDDQRFRAYRLSVSARNLFNNLLDFEIGRQFLHPGMPFGSLDGANIYLKFNRRITWQLFGGVESNLGRSFKVYEWDDANVLGTTVKYRDFYKTDVHLLFLNKRSQDIDQWQIAGLNLTNFAFTDFHFMLQAHYDLINSRFHRLYFSGRYFPGRWNLVFHVKQQFPQIYGDSFFSIFSVKKYRQLGLSTGYRLTERFSVDAGYQLIQLEEGRGHRIRAGFGDRNGSVALLYETGDLGDELGVMLDYGYEVVRDLIASVSVNYSRYRFEEIYDYENQWGNAVRLAYNFDRHWRIDLEYQWLQNKFRDSDNRILNHIHFIW